MTPAEIKRTKLYRTLARCIVKKDREELARMLAMVPKYAMNRGLNSNKLGSAFWWSESPQGRDYWATLYIRMINAGHDCW